MTELERVAYHEAGHALAHCILHMRFKGVSIVANNRSLGRVPGAPFPAWLADAGPTKKRSWIEKRIMCTLAGSAVDEILGLSTNASGSDSVSAHLLASNLLEWKLLGNEQEARAFVSGLYQSTKVMMQEQGNWATIEALVRKLLERGRLSAWQVRCIKIGREQATQSDMTRPRADTGEVS